MPAVLAWSERRWGPGSDSEMDALRGFGILLALAISQALYF